MAQNFPCILTFYYINEKKIIYYFIILDSLNYRFNLSTNTNEPTLLFLSPKSLFPNFLWLILLLNKFKHNLISVEPYISVCLQSFPSQIILYHLPPTTTPSQKKQLILNFSHPLLNRNSYLAIYSGLVHKQVWQWKHCDSGILYTKVGYHLLVTQIK